MSSYNNYGGGRGGRGGEGGRGGGGGDGWRNGRNPQVRHGVCDFAFVFSRSTCHSHAGPTLRRDLLIFLSPADTLSALRCLWPGSQGASSSLEAF